MSATEKRLEVRRRAAALGLRLVECEDCTRDPVAHRHARIAMRVSRVESPAALALLEELLARLGA